MHNRDRLQQIYRQRKTTREALQRLQDPQRRAEAHNTLVSINQHITELRTRRPS